MRIHLKVPLVTGTTYTAFFDDVQIVPGPPPAGLTPTLSLNYAYDGFGNLTSKGATNGQYSTSLIVEGKTNRVVSAGGVTFGYTANGSAQPSGTSVDTFTYDTLNRLMRTNSGGSQYFGYGYLPGTNTRLLYGRVFAGTMFPSLDFYGPDGKLLANYQISQGSTPTEVARYLYLEGKPLNWPEDRIGSAGNYMPYGDYPSTSQDPGVYGTYLADMGTGAGGFFAKQRYYNSNWTRFLTVDPLGSSARVGLPQSWNRYGYVLGDPVNVNDPTGLDTICIQVPSGGEGLQTGSGATQCFETDPGVNGVSVDGNGNHGQVKVKGTSVTVTDTPLGPDTTRVFLGFDTPSHGQVYATPSFWSGSSSGSSSGAANNGTPQMPQQPTKSQERLERLKNCALGYYGIDPLSVTGLSSGAKWGLIALSAGGIPKSWASSLGLRVIMQPGASEYTSALSMLSLADWRRWCAPNHCELREQLGRTDSNRICFHRRYCHRNLHWLGLRRES